MTNEEFFNAYRGEPVLYKGKDIGAYVAGYVGDKMTKDVFLPLIHG